MPNHVRWTEVRRRHLFGPAPAVPMFCDELGPLVPVLPESPTQAVAREGTILRVRVGSTVHGMSIDGQDDIDEMGVCLEPPRTVLGSQRFEHYTFRTQPEGVCSGPGDLDLVIYSLRKYARLVGSGNPTTLLPLFVPDEHVVFATDVGRELRRRRDLFLSRAAGPRFKGYLAGQRDGLLGLRSGGSRNKGRADIRERYGFDCYLDDTEFLTRRGWLRYDQIDDGEAVGTVNQITGQVEFQVPTERVAKPYSGPIHLFRHRYTSCAVTPNHRMWSSPVNRGPSGRIGNVYRPEVADWQFRAAEELRGIQHVRVVGAVREGEYPITDEKIALYGCYLSEGMVAKRRNDGSASVLSMTQQVGGRLESALTMAGGAFPMRTFTYTREDGPRRKPCTYSIYTLANREVAEEIEAACGSGSRDLHLPGWAFDLSRRQAELLLETLMAGDGTRTPNGWQVYYSLSRELAGGVQALAILAGQRSNMWGPYDKGMYQVMVQEPGREFEAVSMRNNHRVERVENARVVCFTVPNETLVTRREGRVAMHGNTKFAAHMVRLGVQGVELLLTGRITLPIPEPELTWLRDLRQGRHTLTEALDRAVDLERQIDEAMLVSPLPPRARREAIDAFVINAHREFWAWGPDAAK